MRANIEDDGDDEEEEEEEIRGGGSSTFEKPKQYTGSLKQPR